MQTFPPGEPGSTWAITLVWHGRGFVGWQRQPNSRSVQQVVEDALAKLHGGNPIFVMASGRTDSGVHAEAQLCSFRSPRDWESSRLFKSLNGVLPEDIACIEARVVPDGFCARRWSHRKHYRYRILDRFSRCPLRDGLVWHLRTPLDVDAMSKAACYLEGLHDFTSFRARGCAAAHPVRRLERVGVQRRRDEVQLDWAGNGFLRYQVRIMTGTLVDVGLGRTAPERVATILADRDRGGAGRTAPAYGLTLVAVDVGEGPVETTLPTSLPK